MREIDSMLERIDAIADELLRSNQTCLICMNDGPMRNGHIVGEQFLKLIANTKTLPELRQKGRIYCWPTSASLITRLALPGLKALLSKGKHGSVEIECYSPVPRPTGHRDCKFTFACDICDNQVLKPTDSVQRFDPQDEETVFKLGLRTFAVYTAWYDGHKRWAKEELARNVNALLLLKQYPLLKPFLQRAFEALSDWGEQQTSLGKQLESEMQRWRNAYQNSDWNQAVSRVIEVSIKPRIAGCGVVYWRGYPVAITILPNKKGTSFVIATTLLDGGASPSSPHEQLTVIRELSEVLQQQFANQSPEQWLPDLSRSCEFLYVSPEDYHDESVVSEAERHTIATAMASKISAIPDLITEDPWQTLRERDPL